MIENNETSVSILHLLHRSGQCADELFAASIGDNSLTPRQYEVLRAVSLSEDPSQTTLVDTTGIDRSTLADIVRRLVQRGLLERRRTRRDARMYAVNLTQDGKRALEAAEPTVAMTSERLLQGLSPDERKALFDALERIITSAKSI